jgi:hypothetical protein
MDAVFSIFVHPTRLSNHDVWRTGGLLCLDRYYSRLYSGIRKLDSFNAKLRYIY